MPSYTRRSPYSCCDDATYTLDGLDHDGDIVYAYSTCDACGATWRDVFTYAYAEQQDGGA